MFFCLKEIIDPIYLRLITVKNKYPECIKFIANVDHTF